ncbi:MAG: hypothetical protein WD066_18380 [Planctomycetaceae bacterium]
MDRSTKRLTLFSWGYYGWGNATRQLVKAVDAVEASRGFAPPLFVDIRIQRSVRAKGFNGGAFEKLVGSNRYRWMKLLGNRRIVNRKGAFIQIAEPKAAGELLELAAETANEGRRIIFYCSCEWPKWNGHVNCHRQTVASLLIRRARNAGIPANVIEWPGGRPERIELDVKSDAFRKIERGQLSIPLGTRVDLARMAGFGIASIDKLRCGSDAIHRVVGPAAWKSGKWVLPVLPEFDAENLADLRRQIARFRRATGLEPQVT